MIRLRRRGQGLLLLLLASCGEAGTGDPPDLPVPRDTYVEVMAELARLRRRPPPARGAPERERLADSARTEILARHAVSAEEIVLFADIAGRDPTLMMEISQAIAELSDSMDAQLAPGRSGGEETTLDKDPEASTSSGASPRPGTDPGAGPPTSDPVPGPRFADPEPDSASDSERFDVETDSAAAPVRTPERPERSPIRRPARTRPPQ